MYRNAGIIREVLVIGLIGIVRNTIKLLLNLIVSEEAAAYLWLKKRK
jgi:hypothetical protein